MPRRSCASALLAAAMVGAMALVGAAPLAAQACVAVPSDNPAFGSPSSAPFGNNNPSDPIFSDLRYQLLLPRALLPAQPFRIRDLQVAPAGSRLRQLRDLTVTLGHSPSGQLGAAMQNNFVGATRSTRVQHWLLPTSANVWAPLGLDLDFVFDPALGDLVVEFRVVGGGAIGGAGTAGFRTDPAIPYVWTNGGGYSGNAFAGGGLKVRLCADTHNLLTLEGGCPGSAGTPPRLSLSGSAQVGGPGVTAGLVDASAQPLALAVLAFSFSLRPTPLDLGVLGAPGCRSYGFEDFTALALANLGAGSVMLAMPAAPFPCLPLFAQWVVLDPLANTPGLALSNPGRILVGN